MDWTILADFAIKAGIPAFLGVMIVYYLLARLIPRLVDTFEKQMAAQQVAFGKAIEEVTRELRGLSESLKTEGIENRKHREAEASETRVAIRDLTKETAALAAAVYEIHDLGPRSPTGEHAKGEPASRRRSTAGA